MDIDDFGRRFRRSKPTKKKWFKKSKRFIHRREVETKPANNTVSQDKRQFRRPNRKYTPGKGRKTGGKPSSSSIGKQCYRCGKLGHWKKDCKVKVNQQELEVEVAERELLENDRNQDFRMREGEDPFPSQETSCLRY